MASDIAHFNRSRVDHEFRRQIVQLHALAGRWREQIVSRRSGMLLCQRETLAAGGGHLHGVRAAIVLGTRARHQPGAA